MAHKKRSREESPLALDDDAAAGGDLSPLKFTRLADFTRQSHMLAPLTGAAALEDIRRWREEEQRAGPPGVSDNSSQHALSELMSSVAAMSRPEDTPAPAAAPASHISSSIEVATITAARALSAVTIPQDNTAASTTTDTQEASPESGTSGASLAESGGQVVHSPGPMDLDARDDGHMYVPQHEAQMYAPQPEAQMEDKAVSSLSYPGILPPGSSMQAPDTPPRRISLPMSSSQNPDLTPRSPSSKKHKCPHCDTEFTRYFNLKSHLLMHSDEKPYRCQACQLRFRRLHDLKRHNKMHTGEKLHICPKCDRKFARSDALVRHSKSAGGCAGRRPSMGSFDSDDDYDGPGSAGADDSAMSGVLYDGGACGDMTEEEKRRSSMPSIKAQHVSGQGPDGYNNHSNTYPPAGQRPTGGWFLRNVDRGSASTTTSPSLPNSYTPNNSISSMPLSAGSSSMFSQSGMTESPKPLSSSGAPVSYASRDAAALARHALSLPTHGMSPAARQAWLSQYPPADRTPPKGNAVAASTVGKQQKQQQQTPGRGRGRTSSGATAQGSNGVGAAENGGNLFSTADDDIWIYFQQLEERVRQLESIVTSKAALVDKISVHKQLIASLTEQVAAMQQQSARPRDESVAQ
ncbi:hypothetical protein B0T26DRAFT_792565 [Lasiosphaeria miniovina]|uniref:C2H2-type domain-containing protein n=1 Tax=Lasiosphaeria miniovina TaxID=1954250 RepID=A0AA39ZTA2_9PEZI|nr:uncharacterized protein B0T26DRAFT_792565 [Lasiosphaeria miniovina]KAK0703306.1 hypothetical protein B0T26DRAFT_792565 [Lasiosphaeria miniovina]